MIKPRVTKKNGTYTCTLKKENWLEGSNDWYPDYSTFPDNCQSFTKEFNLESIKSCVSPALYQQYKRGSNPPAAILLISFNEESASESVNKFDVEYISDGLANLQGNVFSHLSWKAAVERLQTEMNHPQGFCDIFSEL